LAYSIDFEFRSYRTMGYFLVTAIVDSEKSDKTLELIIELLDEIKNNGISSSDLVKTKNYIRGNRLMEEESVLTRAQTLSILEALGFGYNYYLRREQRLEQVSIEHIHQIAEEYFKPENYYIHILS